MKHGKRFRTIDSRTRRVGRSLHETNRRKQNFAKLAGPFGGDRIHDEISCAGVVENLVSEAIADYDITDNGYFEQAVNEVINNYDFDEILDDNLSDKVAQVIGDGEFIFRR